MSNISQSNLYYVPSACASRRNSVWNRRLIIAGVVAVLWTASMLALHAMGPDGRALMAGEGLLIQTDQ